MDYVWNEVGSLLSIHVATDVFESKCKFLVVFL